MTAENAPASATLAASMNGITPVPPGHVAAIKTYLEHRAPPPPEPALPEGITLRRLKGADARLYRAIFFELGRRWLWWSRLQLPPTELATVLDDPCISAFAVNVDGKDCGLLEWDTRQADEPELAFLGLLDGAIGHKLGDRLIAITLSRLNGPGVACVRVNTCTFDHPAALKVYRRNGFVPVSTAIEIVPDPRLTGDLPGDAAPHVPSAGSARMGPVA